MSRRTGLFLLVAAAGFFLYLWPALRAPVVLWSDSALDLDWARRGVGIVSPVPPQPPGVETPLHPAKPAYLLFLRVARGLAREGQEERTIAVVQSLLLWASIAGTSWIFTRRLGWPGLVLLVVLLSFARLRDSATAVMPEALTAALALPIVAGICKLPKSRAALLLLGLAVAVLFWVRPNAGAIVLLLAIVAAASSRRFRDAVPVGLGFLVLFLPIWFLTRAPGRTPELKGLSHPILFGSADYYWSPSLPRRPETGSERDVERFEISQAASRWKETLAGRGPDARRQILWRALHGILGTEFSDRRWSRTYAAWADLSIFATPFLILAGVALVVTALASRAGTAGAIGVALLLLLVAQNLLLGSSPRFALPLLPPLYLLALVSTRVATSTARRSSAVALFALFAFFVTMHPYVTDREWGRIEAAGVKIRQRIPRRSLPRAEPATLHLRMAPPLVPSAAHLEIRDGASRLLYSSAQDPSRESPAISIPLPQALLDENADRPIDLELTSVGTHGELHYLLFPVIPPPWRRGATRAGSDELSPSTGIRRGALDWWAHAGRD